MRVDGLDWVEAAARLFEPSARSRWESPGALALDLDAGTVQTPALDLIDQALVDAVTTPNARLIISMPPQEGKSQRASRWFPHWALTRNPDTRIAIASYEHGMARRWGRTIRTDIEQYPTTGLSIASDQGAQHDWRLNGHQGGVYATGIGGALTGRPVDLLLIDDPFKDRAQAESATIRENVWNWWTDVASTRLAPGAPVILIMTRWHHDDLAGRLLTDAPDTWRFLNIPAQATGDDDPLGRAEGEYLTSTRGRDEQDWERIKRQAGPRTWNALYQGNPTPETAGVFPNEWPRYTHPLWTVDHEGRHILPQSFDRVIQSWDLTFKNSATSDYVAGQVWALQNGRAYLLDQTHARLDFTATLDAILAMTAKWPQAQQVFVEDKANGPAVITSLRSRIPGITPVEPDGGKYARAVAVQPFTAAGAVYLPAPDLLPNVSTLIEEARDFPDAAHDDTVDALTQALNQLFLTPLLTGGGDILTADDLLDLRMEDFGGY